MILEDHCGELGANSTIRHSLSGTYTATESGPVLLDVYNWKDGDYDTLNVNFIDNIRVYPENVDFTVSKNIVSYWTGGTVKLFLDAGPACASQPFLVMSSVSGTWPGFMKSGVHVPINTDDWTWIAFSLINSGLMSNFMGQLDTSGKATATLNVPGFLPSSYIGVVLHFDYVLLSPPGSLPITRASNPVHVFFSP